MATDKVEARKFDPKEFLFRAVVSFICVGVFCVPSYWAMIADNPNRLQTIIVYVSIALVAGIAFTLATTSSGHINWPRLGISLGGGAAVGVGTLVAIHKMLPPPPLPVVLSPTTAGSAVKKQHGEDIRVRRLEHSEEFLVEIVRQGVPHEVTFVVVERGVDSDRTYIVTEDGRSRVKEPKP